MKTILSILAAFAMALTLAVPALAQDDEQGDDGMFADVTVKANCSDVPKSVTITNDSDFEIRVLSISVTAEDLSQLQGARGTGQLPEGTEITPEQATLATGETLTAEAEADQEAEGFIVILAATEAARAQAQAGKVTVAIVGCVEADQAQGLPGMMPATGGGGMAAPSSVPLAPLAGFAALLLSGGYAIWRRR